MTDHRKTAVYIRLSAEDDNVDGRAKRERQCNFSENSVKIICD